MSGGRVGTGWDCAATSAFGFGRVFRRLILCDPADLRRTAVLMTAQGSLLSFSLSQFHHFFSRGLGGRSPSETLSWGAVQAVTNH